MEGRKRGRETSCGRDTSISCLLHVPNWGPGLHRRHEPWLGIELTTLWFMGWHSIHWATPARALLCLLPFWFICLYFSFSYRMAQGYFSEWSHWGSCQLLLMTTCECLSSWVGVCEKEAGETFFSWGNGVLRRREETRLPSPRIT